MNMRSVMTVLAVMAGIALLFIVSLLIASAILGGGKSFVTGGAVGVVEVKGVIVDGLETIEQLHDFRDNDSIKAIVLRIDSPGGVVAPSQEIYEEVKKISAKKKVVVSMGSVAASGGYYVAAPASEIYANPGTITGSIGVIMRFSNIEGLMDKVGLKAYTVKSGPFKDIASPTRPMTEEDRKVMQAVIDSIHAQFIKAVSEGRKLPEEKVREIADGRIFSGEQALKLGLVDKLGGLEDAVKRAGILGGLGDEPTVVYPPKKRKLFGDLFIEEAMERLEGMVARHRGLSVNYEMDGSY